MTPRVEVLDMNYRRPPHGLDELCREFGDVRKFIQNDGTLDPGWEANQIVRIPLPAPLPYEHTSVTRITVHRSLAEHLSDTLRQLHEIGLWAKLHEYGGGFEYRKKRGSNAISIHAWGLGWDFDPGHNQLGTVGTIDHGVVDVFERNGYVWGGRFHGRLDPMHFQFAEGY